MGKSEFPSKNEEERYQNAINETDPTVLERQKQIGNTLPIMMSSAIPGSQYVWGGIGAYGIKKSIDDYKEAKTDEDKNDAIFNGVLSASICLPISKEAEAIIAKRSAELLKSMKNWPKPKLKYKNNYNPTKTIDELLKKYPRVTFTPSATAVSGSVVEPSNLAKKVVEKANSDAVSFIKNKNVINARLFNESVMRRIKKGNKNVHNLAELTERPTNQGVFFMNSPMIDGKRVDAAYGNFGNNFTSAPGNSAIIYDANLPYDRLYNAAFHEPLHNFGLGMPITKEGYDFMNLKADKVLIPREKVAPWK